MASNRVKVYNSVNQGAQNWANVPTTDGFVDIDSVQTVSNKIFTNCTFSGADPSRLGLLMFKATILGQLTLAGELAVCPGLASYMQAALAMT